MSVVLINGVGYSYANFEFSFGGAPIYGIKAFSWKITQEKTNNMGAGEQPTERGRGGKEYEGSMTIQKRELEKIRTQARAQGGQDITDLLPFNIIITASVKGDPTKALQYILKNVEFTEDGDDGSAGDTELVSDIPLIWAGLQNTI